MVDKVDYSDQEGDEQDTDCVLCGGVPFYYSPKPRLGQAHKSWLMWKSEWSRSLCTLLALPTSRFQRPFSRGPYCLNCLKLVWDINLTISQIKNLEDRLKEMKIRLVGDINSRKRSLDNQRAQQQSFSTGTSQEMKMLPIQLTELVFKELEKSASDASGDDFYSNWDWDDFGPETEETSETMKPVADPLSIKQEELESHSFQDDPSADDFDLLHFESSEPEASSVQIVKRKKTSSKSPPRKRSESKTKTATRKKTAKEGFTVESADRMSTIEHRCSLCSNKNLFSLTTLGYHMLREHPNHFFECKICSTRYRIEWKYEAHMKQVHGGLFSFCCNLCKQGFPTQEELDQHESIHKTSNPFTCATCSTVFPNALELERHVPTHVNHFPCTHPKCGKTFVSQDLLDIHSKCHTRTFICGVCGVGFNTKGALSEHKYTHTEEKAFLCELCPASYKMMKGLKRHMMTHTGERPHACRICGKTFRLPFQRTRHEEIHSGIKPYVCKFCGKTWTTNNSLQQHEAEVHGRKRRGENRKKSRKKETYDCSRLVEKVDLS